MNQQQQQQQFPIPVQDTQEPSEEGKRLVALFTDMENKQLDFLDESGKIIIERIATLLAVLFAVTAFGSTFPPPYLKVMYSEVAGITTLLLYLLALGAGLWGIQPRNYRRYTYNVSLLGEELEKMTRHKMLWIRIAAVLFALGTVTLAALIIAIIWTV